MWSTLILALVCWSLPARAQLTRKLAGFTEVYAWKQLTFDIDGVILTQDRDDDPSQSGSRRVRQADSGWNWGNAPSSDDTPERERATSGGRSTTTQRPAVDTTSGGRSTTTQRPAVDSDEGRYFIQYNNVPMGVERVGNRLFVAIPRRRYGIPATLNYIELDRELNNRSPPLKPYPNPRDAQALTSVYRTRADSCGRLWMVDTGRLELATTQRQLRTPAIVIYDLNTNSIIRRYELKASDLPAENTPTGLASITVDITNNACDDAFAYLPDLTTFGLVVYSLRENDSWRHTHNYYSFNPVAGNLFIADQRFQWSDGVFSVSLLPGTNGCKQAYFHSLIGTHEFAVSTCVLKNRTASSDRNYYAQYSVVGDRGEMTQSTMADYHPGTGVMFFAEIGRDAVSCWNTGDVLRSTNVAVLARDTRRFSYPSDLHVTGDDVWVMANTLPRFGYSRFDTNEYNFYVYRGNVHEVIAGTVCNRNPYPFRSGIDDGENTDQ